MGTNGKQEAPAVPDETVLQHLISTFDLYGEMIKRFEAVHKEDDRERIINCGLGISGEAGEVSDIIKKLLLTSMRPGQTEVNLSPEEAVAILEEVGDTMWYGVILCMALRWYPKHILRFNLEKLQARYTDGWKDMTDLEKEEAEKRVEEVRQAWRKYYSQELMVTSLRYQLPSQATFVMQVETYEGASEAPEPEPEGDEVGDFLDGYDRPNKNCLRVRKIYDDEAASMLSNARFYYKGQQGRLERLSTIRDRIYKACRMSQVPPELVVELFNEFVAEFDRLSEKPPKKLDARGQTMLMHSMASASRVYKHFNPSKLQFGGE